MKNVGESVSFISSFLSNSEKRTQSSSEKSTQSSSGELTSNELRVLKN